MCYSLPKSTSPSIFFRGLGHWRKRCYVTCLILRAFGRKSHPSWEWLTNQRHLGLHTVMRIVVIPRKWRYGLRNPASSTQLVFDLALSLLSACLPEKARLEAERASPLRTDWPLVSGSCCGTIRLSAFLQHAVALQLPISPYLDGRRRTKYLLFLLFVSFHASQWHSDYDELPFWVQNKSLYADKFLL